MSPTSGRRSNAMQYRMQFFSRTLQILGFIADASQRTLQFEKNLTILVMQKYLLNRMVYRLKETHLFFREKIKILLFDGSSFRNL